MQGRAEKACDAGLLTATPPIRSAQEEVPAGLLASFLLLIVARRKRRGLLRELARLLLSLSSDRGSGERLLCHR